MYNDLELGIIDEQIVCESNGIPLPNQRLIRKRLPYNYNTLWLLEDDAAKKTNNAR